MRDFFPQEITQNASFFITTEPDKVMENIHGRKRTSVVIIHFEDGDDFPTPFIYRYPEFQRY